MRTRGISTLPYTRPTSLPFNLLGPTEHISWNQPFKVAKPR